MNRDEFDDELRAVVRQAVHRQAPDHLRQRIAGVTDLPPRPPVRISFAWRLAAGAAVAAVALIAVVASLGIVRPPAIGPSPSPSVGPTAFTTSAPTSPGAIWASLTWHQLAANDPLARVKSVLHWRGGYLAFGHDFLDADPTAEFPIWISSDGGTWRALSGDVFGQHAFVFGVAEVSTGLVALTATLPETCRSDGTCGTVSNPIQSWTSPDGEHWTAHPGPRLLPGDIGSQPPLLAAGPAGLLAASQGDAAIAATSTDGLSWQALPTGTWPTGFQLVDLWGRADGYAAIGNVNVDPDHPRGEALWSADGRQWSAADSPLVAAHGGIVHASSGATWRASRFIRGMDGAIAEGHSFGAPGVTIWWQSPDGRHWQLLHDYPPLGPWPGPGEGEGGSPDGTLVTDGSRMFALHPGADAKASVSFDGLGWTQVAMSGAFPLTATGVQVVMPGGVVVADGEHAWYGEASTDAAVTAACANRGSPVGGSDQVLVFYTCDGAASPRPLMRSAAGAATTETRLRAALKALLAGPIDAERAAGYKSFFSAATAGVLKSVTLDAAGKAVVDLADFSADAPNAATSAGSRMLLSQLNATAFQFPEVTGIEYRTDGRCDVFWAWLGGACQVIPRERASGVDIERAPLVVRFILRGELGSFVPDIATTVTADGRVAWNDADGDLVERQLTDAGLRHVREALSDTHRLDRDASFGRDRLPGAEPPARGVGSWIFQAVNAGGKLVTVSMVAIDGDESQYWVTSPERTALDALGRKLRAPEAWLPTADWAGPSRQPYQPQAWMAILYTQPGEAPPPGTRDFTDYPWPILDPMSYGVSADDPTVQKIGTVRCGYLSDDAVAPIVEQLRADGVLAGTPAQGVSQADLAYPLLDGRIDVTLVKILPDGSPGCSEVRG